MELTNTNKRKSNITINKKRLISVAFSYREYVKRDNPAGKCLNIFRGGKIIIIFLKY